MAWDSLDQALDRLKGRELKHWGNYLGFYSSWLDGYFREPWGMLLPMDDHGFHRGDGVFEAARIHEGAYIDLEAHLKRLERSAAAIGMKLPKSVPEIAAICVELGRRAKPDFGVLRLFVTRGPGGFSPNPAEVVGHQLYAAVTAMRPPDARMYERGCRAMLSSVAAKDPFWAQIKSCNYLQNVLMKKESVERGYDFSISLGAGGRLSEGATENLLVVDAEGRVRVPRFDYTLRGTTVSEVMRLAEDMGLEVRLADVHRDELFAAREAAFVGTTLGVLPIASVDDRPIGTGRPGEVCRELNRRWMEKMSTDPSLRTAF